MRLTFPPEYGIVTAEVKGMGNVQTVNIPVKVIEHIRIALQELEDSVSVYKPEFLARMYRSRANDLENRGKSLAEIRKRFKNN